MLEEMIKRDLNHPSIVFWGLYNEFEHMRLGGYNNKGLLDEYRRPKSTYETVKQLHKNYNPKGDRETIIELY